MSLKRITRFFQKTVTTTTLQVIAYNKDRAGLLLKNLSGSAAYISSDSNAITTNGYRLDVGEFLSFIKVDGDMSETQIYAATSAGTADLRIVESFVVEAP
jgi:hypothetical protein